MDERIRLRLPGHPARRRRDLHVALAAFRQVLPYFPKVRAVRCELLQGHRRARRTGAMPPLRRTVRLEDARRGFDRGRAEAGFSLRNVQWGRALSMDLSEMPPRDDGFGAREVVARGITDLRFGI